MSLLVSSQTLAQSQSEIDSTESSSDFIEVTAELVSLQEETSNIISKLPDVFKDSGGESSSFIKFFLNYRSNLMRALDGLDLNAVVRLAAKISKTRETGNSIYVFGNGGSSAAASHLAADLGKIRFEDSRSFFRITSLSDNSALITATANDSGYEQVFSHQLQRFLKPNDLVVAISSSGNSENILKGLKAAKDIGANTVAIVGFTGGKASDIAEAVVYIPTNVGDYGAMEDISSVVIHLLVNYIYSEDKKVFG